MRSCCGRMSNFAVTCSASWRRPATPAGGRRFTRAPRRYLSSASGRQSSQERPCTPALRLPAESLLARQRHSVSVVKKRSANKRLLQFSKLLEFLAAPRAFVEYMLPGALQIFGRPALATRVGAFNLREVSGQFGMPVL